MLTLPATDFNFTGTVRAHGWSVLAPFDWDPRAQTLTRTEELDGGRVVVLTITWRGESDAGLSGEICIETDPDCAGFEREQLMSRVSRMMALDLDLGPFWRLCRQFGRGRVADLRLGRLLRAPSLFEDLVKIILTLNVRWQRTVVMARALVERLGAPHSSGRRAFPSPQSIVSAGEDLLRSELRLGYRSRSIIELAQTFLSPGLAESLEDLALTDDQILSLLGQFRGFGPYASAAAMALLHRFSRLPVDSEFARHVASLPPSSAGGWYDEWGDWRYLGYWSEASGWDQG